MRFRQLTLPQFEAAFYAECACREYLRSRRWPDGVTCPRCGNVKVYALRSNPHHWQCHRCGPQGYRFSVLVGTAFENTSLPLSVWFKAIYLIASKRAINAYRIYRMLGLGSYRTARSMYDRLLAGMSGEELLRLTTGFVDIDDGAPIGAGHDVVRPSVRRTIKARVERLPTRTVPKSNGGRA
jgi:transposase-like protein